MSQPSVCPPPEGDSELRAAWSRSVFNRGRDRAEASGVFAPGRILSALPVYEAPVQSLDSSGMRMVYTWAGAAAIYAGVFAMWYWLVG